MTRLAAWLGVWSLALTIAAAQPPVSPGTGNGGAALPATPSWRERYTLGPGDILNFAFYGRPELDRNQVFIQPDGTVSYLQAQGVRAEGLTIDELRTAVEKELSGYHRNARVMIAPFELRSKRYVILGKVIDKGAFPMDRPITIIEAVARARGIETGLFEQNTVELADLPRSFLIRGGRRLPIDFERLFLQGDLTQNIPLEPGDYLYFPSANTNEIYVLGEVGVPGVQGFTTGMTVVGAITMRSGFSVAAYRSRVLIVRGSLGTPVRLVVDLDAVLAGRQPDVPLQPKDIVFVSARPWRLVEELADAATNAFLESMTARWAGQNVTTQISDPLLPQRRPVTK